MVNVFAILKPILHAVMKMAGVKPQKIEIEPGTVMNFWVPIETNRNGSKRPSVVFLHGFCADGILTWLFQVLSLTSKHNVYVPDLLFFGASITDNPDRSTSFQADCVAKGLQKLGVERCTVVGLSYGGIVGFKLAKMHPGLVESLVASDTVMELTETISNSSLDKIGFSSWSEYLLPETVAGLKVLLSIASYSKIFTRFPNFVYKNFLEVMFDNRKERVELLKALVVPDNEVTPAEDYSQKFYLLWGEDDEIFNLEVANHLKRQLGDKATLRYIEKAGHIPQLERPIMYNQILKKILESIHM